MKVTKKEVIKSQVEIIVELSLEEFAPYINKASEEISKEVKVDGFRAGKIPYDILKQKVGEMAILEEGARTAIRKTLDKALLELGDQRMVGQPRIDILKLAPGNPMEYKILIALLPDVTLGEYKDLKIKSEKTKVEDADIEKTLNELKEIKVKEMLVDREAKEGDKVLMDIKMFHDKVPLEGGQAVDTAIIIGQNNLVPGFDKHIAGAKKGEQKTFSLPYPDDHFMKNIAGKLVEFNVTIKDVYERVLPEMNDELAKSFGLKNLEELKTNIKKSIESEKNQEKRRQTEKDVIEKVLAKTKFGDIPEILLDDEAKNMIHELKHGISEQGGRFEDYLASIKKTEKEMMVDMMPDAMKRVKASLLIREIATAEKITVKPEEVKENIEHMKSHYKDQPNVLKQLDSKEYYNYVVNVETSRKVIDALIGWNVVEK